MTVYDGWWWFESSKLGGLYGFMMVYYGFTMGVDYDDGSSWLVNKNWLLTMVIQTTGEYPKKVYID